MRSNQFEYLNMLHEILFSLLGYPGELIIDNGSTYIINSEFDLFTPSEIQQLNRIIPLGWYYYHLQAFVDNNQILWKVKYNDNERGRSYIFGVSAGISDLLSEYCEDVAYLEQYVLTEGPTALSYLHQHLQKYIISMPIIWKIIKDMVDKNIKGCQILDFLMNIKSGLPVVNDVVQRLLYHTRVIFLKQCISWCLYGELDDPGLEFFIGKRHHKNPKENNLNSKVMSRLQTLDSVLHTKNHSNSISSSVNDFDWASSYFLKIEYLPESQISLKLGSKLLFCGKAVKLLKLANMHGMINSNSSNHVTGESQRLEFISILDSGYKEFYQYFAGNEYLLTKNNTYVKNPSIKSVTNDNSAIDSDLNIVLSAYLYKIGFQKEDLYSFTSKYQYLVDNHHETAFTEYFEPLILDIHNVLSKRLWEWLKYSMKFIAFLKVLRNVFLLGRGEFFQLILDNILGYIQAIDNNRYSKFHSNKLHQYMKKLISRDQADVILNDILNQVVKELGFDDESAVTSLLSLHVSTSKFSFNVNSSVYNSSKAGQDTASTSPVSTKSQSSPSQRYRQQKSLQTYNRYQYKNEIILVGSAAYPDNSDEASYIYDEDLDGYIVLCMQYDSVINTSATVAEEYHKNANMLEEPVISSDLSSNNEIPDLDRFNYIHGSINLVDRKYVAKGFVSSLGFNINWNDLLTVLSSKLFISSAESILKYSSPQKRPYSNSAYSSTKTVGISTDGIVLGGISYTLHNDHRFGNQGLGRGLLGTDGFTESINVGVSFHAFLKKDDKISYQARIYVSKYHSPNSHNNRSFDTSKTPVKSSQTEFNPLKLEISDDGYEYDILGFKNIEVSFQNIDNYDSSNGYEHDKVFNGYLPFHFGIEYVRELTSENISSSSSIHSSNTKYSKNSINTASTGVNSLAYIIKVKLHQNANLNLNSDSSDWDLEVPIDISKVIRLQSGQCQVCIVGSAIQLSLAHNHSHPKYVQGGKTDVDVARKSQDVNNMGFLVSKLEFDSNGALSSYPVASTYTTARYPETTLRLESQISQYRLWMNLKLDFRYPDIFHVVLDQDAKSCYQRIFSMLMKIKLVCNALEKLWIAENTIARLVHDRRFCHLRHSMHFFLNNLLYYLQVDVIDSEFSELLKTVNEAVDMQIVLKTHRIFLSNVSKMSFIDNVNIQESFDRILQVCLRFISLCQLLYLDQHYQLSQSEYQEKQRKAEDIFSSSFREANVKFMGENPRDDIDHQSVMSSFTSLSSLITVDQNINAVSDKIPLVIPPEELDAVRKEFFSQVSYLFHVMSMLETKGFMFRLDFNGYLSQLVQESIGSKIN